MGALLDTAHAPLESCRETTAALANIVPENQFWRWKEMWQNSLRNAVFSATLVEYLSSGGLMTLPAVAETLGGTCYLTEYMDQITLISVVVRPEWQGRFALPAEDYLHGVITLVNELVSTPFYSMQAVSVLTRPVVPVGCQRRDPRRFRAADQNITFRQRSLRWICYGAYVMHPCRHLLTFFQTLCPAKSQE